MRPITRCPGALQTAPLSVRIWTLEETCWEHNDAWRGRMRRPVQAVAGLIRVKVGSRQAQASRRGPQLKMKLAAVPMALSSLVASPALAADITEFPLPTPGSAPMRI